jgi:hypothetical protein
MADLMNATQPKEEELYCYWRDCLRPFPGHDALSHHLSEGNHRTYFSVLEEVASYNVGYPAAMLFYALTYSLFIFL